MKLAECCLLTTVIVSGCGQQYVEVEELLNHNACKGLSQGLHSITPGRLPALRGVTLLEVSGTAKQAETELQSGGVLIAISNGEQPTLGYAMHPLSATLDGTHLTMDYSWQTPDPTRQHAQTLSSPCSVIRLPPEQVERLSVTVEGIALGSLEIQPLTQ